jgi:chromosome segregation ATPase
MNKNDNVTKHETEIGALLEQIEQLEADSGNWEGAYKWADEDRNKLEKENQKLREAIRRLIEKYEPHRSSMWGVHIFIQDLQKALEE